MQFALKKGVYIVRGYSRAALYDTNSGKVYSINRSALDIIEKQKNDIRFWRQLLSIGLAVEVNGPPQKDVVLPYLPEAIGAPNSVHLSFIWFEVVTTDCNEWCRHCYVDAAPPPSFGKGIRLSIREREDKKHHRLPFRRWVELIHEGRRLGADSCQFIGGEPFL